MSRLRVFFSLVLIWGSCCCVTASAADHPTNVLMVAIDDLKTIGTIYAEEPGNFLQRVYPDPALRAEVARRMTPNLQRLADRGVTFMNAYCAAPACNPSRAALMTGIRPPGRRGRNGRRTGAVVVTGTVGRADRHHDPDVDRAAIQHPAVFRAHLFDRASRRRLSGSKR